MRSIHSFIRHAPRIRTAMVFAVAVTFIGCSWSNKAKGTAAGTAGGAAVGGVIGSQTGSTARGAIIGAVVGGGAGAVIGRQMDQQAKELKVEIPGAVVERVGEGIQVTFASGLLFDFDSDAIRPASAANLQQLAASLKKYSDTDLLIVGHTDSSGSHGLQPEPVDATLERGVRVPRHAGGQREPDAHLRHGRNGTAGDERDRSRSASQSANRSGDLRLGGSPHRREIRVGSPPVRQ